MHDEEGFHPYLDFPFASNAHENLRVHLVSGAPLFTSLYKATSYGWGHVGSAMPVLAYLVARLI